MSQTGPQARQKKRIIVVGSTGSIGASTLDVARNLAADVEVVALAAGSRWEPLLEQAKEFRPQVVALTDSRAMDHFRKAINGSGENTNPRMFAGADGLVEMVRSTNAEMVVAAISGAAGLPASIAALESGKDLALANKESMVCAGEILNRLAAQHGRSILPVDSEHSAIFQALRSGRNCEVNAVILTASGGPFRKFTLEQLSKVTPAQALRHPTWQMGAKITIDSASLMNKALEVIEARWLFDMPAAKIRVVVHPQSIVHSLVEFVDGSTICQLGPPDMRIPIQYAITFPERRPLKTQQLSLTEIGSLTFEEPDPGRFPSLRMAYEVLGRGGTSAAVFNAANEVAVDLFLKNKIGFLRIFDLVEHAITSHNVVDHPPLQAILDADRWAREEVNRVFAGR